MNGGLYIGLVKLDDPCILFALRRESGPFRRLFPPRQPFPGAPCWMQLCNGGVVIAETGVGQAKVAHVLDWLLARPTFGGKPYEPRLLIFAGFAGALDEGLHVGDIVSPDEVFDEHGQSWRTSWPENRRGRLLTVDQLTATPAERQRLAERHQACAVDMESAVFARRCTQTGVPFACVRAISDEVGTTLSPALVTLLSHGTVSPWRFLWALAKRPTLLPEMWRLARATRRASEQLALALRDQIRG